MKAVLLLLALVVLWQISSACEDQESLMGKDVSDNEKARHASNWYRLPKSLRVSRPFIPKSHLKHLHSYKYGGVDASLIAKYVLQPYWRNLVKLVPEWVAPNLITLSGLLATASTLGIVYFYSPNMVIECPSWVYYSIALGAWVYQSLDAIDGKQARRTGTSGPLGELFDHGCDALNASIIALLIGACTRISLAKLWVLQAVLLFCFYAHTWEEYYTHELNLGVVNGPDEGQLLFILIAILSGTYGNGKIVQSHLCSSLHSLAVALSLSLSLSCPSLSLLPMPTYMLKCFQLSCAYHHNLHTALGTGMWHQPIEWLQSRFGWTVSATDLLIPAYMCSAVLITVPPMRRVWLATQSQESEHSFRSALLSFSVIGLYLLGPTLWFYYRPETVERHPYTFFLAVGVGFSTIVGRVIVAYVSHCPIPSLPWQTVGWFAANGLLSLPSKWLPFSLSNQVHMLHALAGLYWLYHCYFVHSVITQICDFLDIKCLTISPASLKIE